MIVIAMVIGMAAVFILGCTVGIAIARERIEDAVDS